MKSMKFNLRTNTLILATLLIIAGCSSAGSRSGVQAKPNTLTKKEIAQDFELLFDGTLESLQKNFKGVTDELNVISPIPWSFLRIYAAR